MTQTFTSDGKFPLKSCLPVAWALFLLGNFFAHADSTTPVDTGGNDALDFLVMNVCLDENGQPTLQNPLNTNKSAPKWVSMRNFKPGDKLPYYDGSWTTPSNTISRRYSLISSTVGTDQNGTQYPIVVVWTDHTGTGQWSPKNNVSAMTVQDGYASDMGSTGGGQLSVNLGSGYLNPKSKGIARFNKAWVFFPEKLIPNNEVNYGVYSEQLANFKREKFSPDKLPPPSTSSKDESHLRSYFSVQGHQVFGYGPDSSIKLDSLIENKYNGRDDAGTSPSNATAMERCYFTRELGLSRWEAWKRVDDGTGDEVAKASAFYALGTCGIPASLPKVDINPHFINYPVQVVQTPQGHAYAQKMKTWDDKTQSLVEHTWYITGCADWTHVEVQPPFDPLAVVEGKNDLLKDLLGLFVADGASKCQGRSRARWPPTVEFSRFIHDL